MRAFYFITKSEYGGAQTHVWQMARFMRSLGHEVAVMSSPGGWLESAVKETGAHFYSNPYLANTLAPIADFRAARLLKNALADFKPDLVSCHSTKAGIIGRLTIRNRIPTIFTAHGWGFTAGVGAVQKVSTVIAEKLAARWCVRIICVSDYDRELALRHGIAPPDKLVTIHNGVELDVPAASFDIGDYLAVNIIFIGRFSRQKDPRLFLEAFGALPDELRHRVRRIEMVGGGPQRAELERFAAASNFARKVIFRGELSRAETLDALSNAHVFVLTSRYEGFPRSVLEAMAARLAVIASDVGGVKEAVTSECGILVPRGDKRAVTRALETLLREPERIRTMAAHARERAVRHFPLEAMLKETLRVYQVALG